MYNFNIWGFGQHKEANDSFNESQVASASVSVKLSLSFLNGDSGEYEGPTVDGTT